MILNGSYTLDTFSIWSIISKRKISIQRTGLNCYMVRITSPYHEEPKTFTINHNRFHRLVDNYDIDLKTPGLRSIGDAFLQGMALGRTGLVFSDGSMNENIISKLRKMGYTVELLNPTDISHCYKVL